MNKNAISVDVEDYFQVAAFFNSVEKSDWDTYESRVVKNTRNILALFDNHNIKATFFVLGWVAERNKELVADIAKRGHEVASHGYSHQLIYEQTPKIFREETIRSKSILEDIIQKPILGYRAASYSITKDSLWALDILAESGFVYDSSIFPVRHDRYGIPGADEVPHRLKSPDGHELVEFPLTTLNLFGYRLPIAGGGYFRLYPYLMTWLSYQYLSRVKQRPLIFYLHPWEIDPEQPKIKAGFLSQFRHYNNLKKCEARLNRLVKDFEFTTVEKVLKNIKLLN